MKRNREGEWVSLYWHPAVATDAVVFGFDGKDLNILLVQRKEEPFKDKWALPGGFLEEKDCSAMECVKRELMEETNVRDVELKEFGTFSDRLRDPRERVITIAFRGLVKKDAFEVRAASDAKTLEWSKLGDLPELAFDHENIIQAALNDLKSGLLLEPVCFDLLNEEFSLTELQNIFIAILDPQRSNKKLCDRRSFKKKMDSLGYIERIEGVTKTECGYRLTNFFMFNKGACQKNKRRWIQIMSDFM